MDDRSNRVVVTNFADMKIFVTRARRWLSFSMVWTGLALHG
jgi:hypothetical protein